MVPRECAPAETHIPAPFPNLLLSCRAKHGRLSALRISRSAIMANLGGTAETKRFRPCKSRDGFVFFYGKTEMLFLISFIYYRRKGSAEDEYCMRRSRFHGGIDDPWLDQ